jgi:NAD(P)-dependent dehydrogenase (short-subunit alcohol dehydrogenase family)
MNTAESKVSLANRVALVTGAGSGIGRETAMAFRNAGARVAVADISLAGARETVRLMGASPEEAQAIEVDVSAPRSVEAMVAATLKHFGTLDCAVNNAGIKGTGTLLHELDDAEWQRILAVNLGGVYQCMKHELPSMAAARRGAIVNISSVAGVVGVATIAYTASKHGVVGLTRAAALQYGPLGIRINAICPGAIDTPMTADIPKGQRLVGAIGRTAHPSEIAQAALWLCSDASSFVLGQALAVDGGWTTL